MTWVMGDGGCGFFGLLLRTVGTASGGGDDDGGVLQATYRRHA